MSNPRTIRAPRGRDLRCKGWRQEGALRMLMNNLDPEVAERPDDLVVYGGTGRAARSWEAFDAIVRSLESLENDETLLVASGKPVGIFRTHEDSPRVLIANANLVGHWSNWETFHHLERLGLTMYGQMTAGSWIYIGSQGIVLGTFETFSAAAVRHFGGSLNGKLVVSRRDGRHGGARNPPARPGGNTAGSTSILLEIKKRTGDRIPLIDGADRHRELDQPQAWCCGEMVVAADRALELVSAEDPDI